MTLICKRLLLAIIFTVALTSPPIEAAGKVHITGGGQGTFGIDLDGDGDIDGSHFGIGVEIVGAEAKGHFTCLMAGNKDFSRTPSNVGRRQGRERNRQSSRWKRRVRGIRNLAHR